MTPSYSQQPRCPPKAESRRFAWRNVASAGNDSQAGRLRESSAEQDAFVHERLGTQGLDEMGQGRRVHAAAVHGVDELRRDLFDAIDDLKDRLVPAEDARAAVEGAHFFAKVLRDDGRLLA